MKKKVWYELIPDKWLLNVFRITGITISIFFIFVIYVAIKTGAPFDGAIVIIGLMLAVIILTIINWNNLLYHYKKRVE